MPFLSLFLGEGSPTKIDYTRPPRWPVIGVPGEVPAIDQHLLKKGSVVT